MHKGWTCLFLSYHYNMVTLSSALFRSSSLVIDRVSHPKQLLLLRTPVRAESLSTVHGCVFWVYILSPQIWEAIQSNAALQNPSILNKFILLTFAVSTRVFCFMLLLANFLYCYDPECVISGFFSGFEEVSLLLLVLLPSTLFLWRHLNYPRTCRSKWEVLPKAGLYELFSMDLTLWTWKSEIKKSS